MIGVACFSGRHELKVPPHGTQTRVVSLTGSLCLLAAPFGSMHVSSRERELFFTIYLTRCITFQFIIVFFDLYFFLQYYPAARCMYTRGNVCVVLTFVLFFSLPPGQVGGAEERVRGFPVRRKPVHIQDGGLPAAEHVLRREGTCRRPFPHLLDALPHGR